MAIRSSRKEEEIRRNSCKEEEEHGKELYSKVKEKETVRSS
jgi:hypothetical protein